MAETTIKDANDLLKAWNAEGVGAAEQKERVQALLGSSLTMVEAAASWAAGLEGHERAKAEQVIFGMTALMDGRELARYRRRLAKILGMSIGEFNDQQKAAASTTKERKEAIPTLGGPIDGWLVEYLYDPEKQEAKLAWRDPEGRIAMGETVTINGTTYRPKEPGSFIKNGGVIFPSGLGQLKSTQELATLVEAFVSEHYLLENRYLGKIIAYYVLLTWIYDCFNALPYLRAVGEAGAGKSELMRRIGHLCYRMLAASGANSAASFFRATEMYRGTVFLDEADLQDGGDMTNDLVKFLNQGAMRGNPIWRLEEVMTENGKNYEVATFQTFCPKLIAMRREFRDDAVASRSLTLKLTPREPIELKMRGVKLYINDEFRQRALAIRNMLLHWRLKHWLPEIEVGEELMDLDISSRLNQVTMPIKALAAGDPALMAEIEKFLRMYNQEIVLTRSMTIAARVVEAMWKIHNYGDLRQRFIGLTQEGGDEYMMVGDIKTIANEIVDDMNADAGEKDGQEQGDKKARKRDALTARGVGAIIRGELQLQVGQRRGNGFPVFWDEVKMLALAKRYGVDTNLTPQPISRNGKGGQAAEPPEAAPQARQVRMEMEAPFPDDDDYGDPGDD